MDTPLDTFSDTGVNIFFQFKKTYFISQQLFNLFYRMHQ